MELISFNFRSLNLRTTLKSVFDKLAGRPTSVEKDDEKPVIRFRCTGMRTRRRIEFEADAQTNPRDENEKQKEKQKEKQEQEPCETRVLRLLETPTAIHFWGHHVTWDGFVDEIICLDNRIEVFTEWWENILDRVYYRLETKGGRQLWLYRTAEGDYLHGLLE